MREPGPTIPLVDEDGYIVGWCQNPTYGSVTANAVCVVYCPGRFFASGTSGDGVKYEEWNSSLI